MTKSNSFLLLLILASALCGCTFTRQELTPCVNLLDPVPVQEKMHLSGTLFFLEESSIIAQDGASLIEKTLIDLSSWSRSDIVGVSPNGEWLAYIVNDSTNTRRTVGLISPTETLTITPAEKITVGSSETEMVTWWKDYGWINDELIMAASGEIGVAILDPFTGSWHQELKQVLPMRFDDSGIAFSPDMKQALYVRGSILITVLSLWDIENERELWHEVYSDSLPNYKTANLHPATWSSDSSMLAFSISMPSDLVLPGEHHISIYVIRGSEVRRIRRDAPDNSGYGYSWSPNGRYLAFMASVMSDPKRRGIVVYDMVDDVAVDICPLEENDYPFSALEIPRLIWSPDSRYLAFGRWHEIRDEENQIVMLDIYTGEVISLKTGAFNSLIGWSQVDTWVEP